MVALTIIGAGGHAKVVIATARAAGWDVAGIADDDRSLWGRTLMDCPIFGPTATVLGENRTLTTFQDTFAPYAVHLYQLH